MASTRWASATNSSRRVALPSYMPRSLLARDAPEGRADRHADAREIALAQHVARHDLARGEDVGRWPAVVHAHARLLVHAHAEIGEGDSRPQRPGEIRRRVDRAGPVRLRRIDVRGRAIVEHRVV